MQNAAHTLSIYLSIYLCRKKLHDLLKCDRIYSGFGLQFSFNHESMCVCLCGETHIFLYLMFLAVGLIKSPSMHFRDSVSPSIFQTLMGWERIYTCV